MNVFMFRMFQVLDKIENPTVKLAMHKSVQRRNSKANNEFDDRTERAIMMTHELKIEHDIFCCKVRKNNPNAIGQYIDEIQIKLITQGLNIYKMKAIES